MGDARVDAAADLEEGTGLVDEAGAAHPRARRHLRQRDQAVELGGAPHGVASNLKILGWRANGDGLHVFGSWKVSDLFRSFQNILDLFSDYVLEACPTISDLFETVFEWSSLRFFVFKVQIS